MRKAFLSFFLLVFYWSCEPPHDYYFKEKAGGHRAFGLEGVYIFTFKISDSLETCDTLRFERIRKNNFLIAGFSSNDTVYYGEILKRKGLYFMNTPSNQKGWWHITAFKFSGDSLYNYWGLHSNSSYFKEVKGRKLFSDYNETELGFYINNSSTETYDAMRFSVLNGDRVGYKELYLDEKAKEKNAEIIKTANPRFLVYPNPVKEILNIETKSDGNFLAEIIDINGKIVRAENFLESYIAMDVASIPDGNYMARLTELKGGHQYFFKIIVTK